MATAKSPRCAIPPLARIIPAHGQDVAGGGVKATLKQASQTPPLQRIFQIGFKRININRQLILGQDIVKGIFIGGLHIVGLESQPLPNFGQQALGIGDGMAIVFADVGQQLLVAPERNPISTPEGGEFPAGQLFAGIPFALAVVENPAFAKGIVQATHQAIRQLALVGAISRSVPFGRLHIINRDKSRFPAHGQPHITGQQISVYLVAQGDQCFPLFGGVRLGDTRIFVQPLH